MRYIDTDKLKAEIERQQRNLMLLSNTEQVSVRRDCALQNAAYSYILSIISSLQQEPRFPQYDNIVDKVFGAGNLEGFEYREAEMLVALAKEELLKSLQQEQEDMGEVSDGYHTFNELYYYRMLYNAAFFNLLPKEWVHKSKRHHTGEECFGGGWFIVMANLPTGQVSNHYELKDWDLFKVPEKEIADEWDGHTPQEAAKRIYEYLQQEQPEIELGKFTEKIKTFQGRYKYPEILSIKGAMAFMARMFYQYPNVARQWYDRLPKTIMD